LQFSTERSRQLIHCIQAILDSITSTPLLLMNHE